MLPAAWGRMIDNRDILTSRSFHPAKHRSCRTPSDSSIIRASRHSPSHPINTPRRLSTHEDLNLRMPPPGGPYMHRACLPCECYVPTVVVKHNHHSTDNSRCATASRRDFAWRQSPGGQRAAPLLACLALLWHCRQAEHRIVGHRISKGKTAVFMIDNSFPKKSFIGPNQ